ncbi:hypothetical protein [Pseudomonas xantholysinigenes]|uniref:Uncharacterized protein n=1 Tax=Pseudomonas xantholysinigenes TaxID=2745490 RepID=A0A9E6U045_9PSED|nr:hypothetical protein [Pseudomonas xantholysinigenes]QXI40762.1 hypothetical protein HU772_012050 [Pseudomonas xantholysinigenes]
MFNQPPLRSLQTLIAASLLLGGCSINGSYNDAAEADAAKVRFISKMDSATLDVYDAQHCMGRTTGLLNNLFVANTRRRADMAVAAPDDAKAYLEFRVTPGRELFLVTNSVGTGVVCGSAFNLTPQPGGEYEVTFNWSGDHCITALTSLNQVNGQVSRLPLPVIRQGIDRCEGSNPLFPKPAQGQPDTPQRTALMEQIIADSLVDSMQPASRDDTPAQREAVQRLLLEGRQQRLGVNLPQAYWDEYQRNLDLTAEAAASRKARLLQQYQDGYRARLRQFDTEALRQRQPDGEATDVKLTLIENAVMLRYYNELSNDLLKQDLRQHVTRMAELDRRYDVCTRVARCWKD